MANLSQEDWHESVGDNGDWNKIHVSDPVLHKWIPDEVVIGKTVLDAGCGNGYLSRHYAKKGTKKVISIDFSPKMVEIAKANSTEEIYSEIDYHVDSTSILETIKNDSIDFIVSNYVIQDAPDYEGAFQAFRRVLRPGGKAFVAFLHPCFYPAERPVKTEKGRELTWGLKNSGQSYYDTFKVVEEPQRWGNFKTGFIWFHRPLSAYWKAITQSGLKIVEFEEPGAKIYDCPTAVLFLLEKPE